MELFLFRFYSERYGFFGEPMQATVEVVPEKEDPKKLRQEDELKEFLEKKAEDINPILKEIARDLVSEGLGSYEQCLKALMECKNNYEKAKQMLLEDEL